MKKTVYIEDEDGKVKAVTEEFVLQDMTSSGEMKECHRFNHPNVLDLM